MIGDEGELVHHCRWCGAVIVVDAATVAFLGSSAAIALAGVCGCEEAAQRRAERVAGPDQGRSEPLEASLT